MNKFNNYSFKKEDEKIRKALVLNILGEEEYFSKNS